MNVYRYAGAAAFATLLGAITQHANAAVSCTIHAQELFSGGYRLEYKVTNTGTANINNWSVNVNFQSAPRINNSWNAVLTGTPIVNAVNTSSNGFLRPGANATFGMTGQRDSAFVVPNCTDAALPAVPQLDTTTLETISRNYGFMWPAVPGAAKYQVQSTRLDADGNPTTWATSFETQSNAAGFGSQGIGRFGHRVNACNAAGQCSGFSAVKKVTSYRITFPENNIVTGDYVVSWTAANPGSQLLENGEPVAGASAGAEGSFTFENRPSGTFTYSLSDLSQTTSIEIKRAAAELEIDRSLFVHDQATLDAADFSLRSVMDTLAGQLTAANPDDPITGATLFARMWDAQNPVENAAGTGVTPCDGTLNGFPAECRPDPEEGQQAADPEFFIDQYRPLALVNRLDLLNRATLADCGEYRIVYGLQGGPGRNLIIFEGVVPNPTPGEQSGCTPIVDLWRSLSSNDNAADRASILRDFYFTGLPQANVRPVVDIRNYSEGSGQIRTNQFMTFSSWNLKEYRVAQDNGLSTLKLVSVKSNPMGEFFDAQNTDPLAVAFRSGFTADLRSLVGDISFISLNMRDDAHNNGESHSSGDTLENDFLAHFSNGSLGSPFEQAIENQLAVFRSDLTVPQVINRATAMTCGGCHMPSAFGLMAPDAVGPGQSWPDSAGFVHVQETADNNGVFPLSPALTDVFLPARRDVMETFIFQTQPQAQQAGEPTELIPEEDPEADKRSG